MLLKLSEEFERRKGPIPLVAVITVRRAQENTVDFGFGPLPTLTPEDLIVSKVSALSVEPNRTADSDDIRAMLKGDSEPDERLIVERLQRLNLSWDRTAFD